MALLFAAAARATYMNQNVQETDGAIVKGDGGFVKETAFANPAQTQGDEYPECVVHPPAARAP
jgi:hypothetical protein